MTPTMRLDILAGIAAVLFLIVGCFVVLRPFLAAILWALILSISTWPAFRWLEQAVGGKKGLAAALMTLALVLALVIPLGILGTSLADDVAALITQLRRIFEEGPPAPPEWVAQIPLVGNRLEAYWTELALGSASLAEELKQHIGPIRKWLIATGANVGQGIVDLSLSVFTAFFIYRDGETGAKSLAAVVERLAGERAQRLLGVAQATLKGVVYGIIGTALAQGTLAAFGLWIAGVPGALFLGLVTAFLSLIPMGPSLVWGASAAWLFYTGNLGWGVFMLLWGFIVISGVDNILKPYFISRGSNLPLILVFMGVFGGVIAFGFLGIFLGPILLGVGYTLVREWGQVGVALAEGGRSR